MFINSFSEQAFSFTHIIFITFSACDAVYDVTDFIRFVRRDVCQEINSMCDFTLDLGDGCYLRIICTHAKVCTVFGSNGTFLYIRLRV